MSHQSSEFQECIEDALDALRDARQYVADDTPTVCGECGLTKHSDMSHVRICAKIDGMIIKLNNLTE